MKITIIWTWYVWLVTGVCLAEFWHEVMCIDIDKEKIHKLKNGIITMYEPGLEELVLRNHSKWRIKFSVSPKEWIVFGKAIFSTVWTPICEENNKADLWFVKSVAKTFWENINEYKLFINKSTVSVWTWALCKKIIMEEMESRWVNIDFDIVSNPEFLREWTAIKDFMLPDRIVIWLDSDKAKNVMREIYSIFERKYINIIYTDIKSSEIIKYASNSFLATKISFINEIANFTEKVWWNILDISRWIWSDKRIWPHFLYSWIWYGWSCFSKDINAFIETWKEYWIDFNIIMATEKVNNNQKIRVIEKLLENFPYLSWKTISILWLSYKPETDDIRGAPSIDIINKLLSLWIKQIKVFDPKAINNIKYIFWFNNNIIYSKNSYDALIGSDALLLLTEWNEFKILNFKKIKNLMIWNVVIDWRNILNKKELLDNNFIYESIW